MTPKEKAKELIDVFLDTDDGLDYETSGGITMFQAKQCALICVDEIRKSLLIIEGIDGYGFEITGLNTEGSIKDIFWQKVKQEIEKL